MPKGFYGEYSGKFNLRLPKSMHKELAQEAKKNRVSLNTYITYILIEQEVRMEAIRQGFILFGERCEN